MSKPSLYIISAKNCPACNRYKNEHHEGVIKLFNSKNYDIKIYDVASTGDDLSKYNISENIRKYIRWFPFFLVVKNNEILDVFNGEKNSSGYNHKTTGSKHPNAENLLEFYEKTISDKNIPVNTLKSPLVVPNSGRPTGYVPTTACSLKFKGRLI